MNGLYKFITQIETNKYRKHLLDKFVDNKNFQKDVVIYNGRYLRYPLAELGEPILELNSILMSTMGYPSIDYALIFRHQSDQPIHIDGHSFVRECSLNLPLSGYENTKMIFYKFKTENCSRRVSDAQYVKKEDLDYDKELSGSDSWVLVNSSVPHQIINVSSSNPRITFCIRFKENPTFAELANK